MTTMLWLTRREEMLGVYGCNVRGATHLLLTRKAVKFWKEATLSPLPTAQHTCGVSTRDVMGYNTAPKRAWLALMGIAGASLIKYARTAASAPARRGRERVRVS